MRNDPEAAPALWVDGGSTVDRWLTLRRYALVLGLLMLAIYADVLTAANTFFLGDFSRIGIPYAAQLRDSFFRGEIPLWNPLNYCGLPFIAQWSTLVFYPPSLFFILLPSPWSLSVFCVVHLYVGGLGMFWLARRWTGSGLGAAAAGLVYVFNGMAAESLLWATISAAMGLTPWVIGAAEEAWNRGGKRWIPAVLLGSLQMMTGAPEHILMTWLFLAILCGSQLFKGGSHAWLLVRRFAMIVALIACVCAVQLLPFLDLLFHSNRGTPISDSNWVMPGWGWANYLVPLFRNVKTIEGLHIQLDQGMFSSYYVGIGTIVLALVAIFVIRTVRVRLLAGLSVVCAVTAMGENGFVYPWLREHISAIGYMRYQLKLAYPLTFLLPMLAAYGLARFQAPARLPVTRPSRALLILTVVILGLMAAIVAFAHTYPQLPTLQEWPLAWRSGWTRASLLLATVGIVILFGRSQTPRAQGCCAALLLALLWIDLTTHTNRPSLTLPSIVFGPVVLEIEPRPQLGLARVMNHPVSEKTMYSYGTTNLLKDMIIRRYDMSGNLNVLEGVPKVSGIQPMIVREFGEFQKILVQNGEAHLNRLADFLAVSHMTSIKTFEWLRRPTFRPMVTAGQRPIFRDRAGTLAGLSDPEVDLEKSVFLPLSATNSVTVRSNATVAINVRSVTAHRWEFTSHADAPALVVIAQTYYHPWKAKVNGKLVPLLRANHAFQAVEVPAGSSDIELVYEDRVFQCGSALSLAALIGIGGTWWRSRRKPATPGDHTATAPDDVEAFRPNSGPFREARPCLREDEDHVQKP